MTQAPADPPVSRWKHALRMLAFLALFYGVAWCLLGDGLARFFPPSSEAIDMALADALVTDVEMNRQQYTYQLNHNVYKHYNFNAFAAADPAARKGMNDTLGYDPSDLGHYLHRGDRLTKAAHSPLLTVRRGLIVTRWLHYSAIPDDTPAPPAQARPSPAPRYAGTYAVTDTAGCALAITIAQHGQGFRFRIGEKEGPVHIDQEGVNTYFTFVGLKGADPAVDVEAAWADSALLIQNYGNSMNPYQRFGQCDAKYLALRRQ